MIPTLLLLLSPALIPAGGDPVQLLSPAPVSARPVVAAEGAARRSRLVRVDLAALAGAAPGQTLVLELFPDLRVEAALEGAGATVDARTWSARLLGQDGRAIFALAGDALAASVRTPRGLYRITWAGPGLHRVSEVDEALLPPCGTGPEHAVRSAGGAATVQAPGGGLQAAAGAELVDVLVVWTPKARNNQGGFSPMESLVSLAVAETNQAYEDSGVSFRLRLVATEELTGYAENGDFQTELNRLTSPTDGWIDQVHTWRDANGADVVSMVVDSAQYAGMAWLMTSVSASFESHAFSVVSRLTATGYYSFGHELGHNMGCAHDRANASTGAYSYSYGYRTPDNAWRTIMAYSPGARLPFYSNPAVTWAGQPLGVAAPALNSAENWKTLNTAAPVIRNWRASAPPLLEVSNLVAARTATLSLSRCTPNGITFFAWSTRGPGPTPTRFGNADLTAPFHPIEVVADANGMSSLSMAVPAKASGRRVWFQGADDTSGQLSNSFSMIVQ